MTAPPGRPVAKTLAGLPPHGVSVQDIQCLQENFDKLCGLVGNVMNNVEKMNERVGRLKQKMQVVLPPLPDL